MEKGLQILYEAQDELTEIGNPSSVQHHEQLLQAINLKNHIVEEFPEMRDVVSHAKNVSKALHK